MVHRLRLGLSAFSGNDGIHVFVNSLASTDAVAKAEVRLIARNNEILATRKTDDCRPRAVRGRAGARRGRAVAGDADGDQRQGRLRLPQPEDRRLRSQRSRRIGPGGAGRRRRFRLCRARGLPLQRDGLSHRAAARRPGQCRHRRAADPGDRAPRRRRVPPRRAGRSGRRRPQPGGAAEFGGARPAPGGCGHLPIPRRPSVGETTFMVEDYIPERIEFDLSSKDKAIKV